MTKQGGSLIRNMKLTSAVFAALCACAVVLPATSSASISCGGRTALNKSGIDDNDVQYWFACSDPVKGFGIITNTSVSIFSDTATTFDPATGRQIDGQSFSCEGNIPGVGVACSGGASGFAAAGKRVVGDIGLAKSPCRRNFKLRVWLVVTDAKGAVSGPFQLGGPKECAAEAKRTSRKGRHAKRSRQ
jgi:hypothetical protein